MGGKIKTLCLLGLVLLGIGCVSHTPRTVTDFSFQKPREPSLNVADLQASQMVSFLRLSVDLLQMMKHGILPVLPYITVNPSHIDLEYPSILNQFYLENVVILDIAQDSGGVFGQRMLVESTDRFGRYDLRDDRIAWCFREPTAREVRMAEQDILSVLSKENRRQIPEELKTDFRQCVKSFQTASGLKPDGLFGRNTAAAVAAGIPVVEVRAAASRVVYPKTPRVRIYVVPQAVVDAEPEKFTQGFGSLHLVRMNALPPEGFASLARKGVSFSAFVYFLDRVDPARPVCIRLSGYKHKADGASGRQWYAAPGKWPVLVESFTLDRLPEIRLANLYLNVCVTDGKKETCIATHQIQ